MKNGFYICQKHLNWPIKKKISVSFLFCFLHLFGLFLLLLSLGGFLPVSFSFLSAMFDIQIGLAGSVFICTL